MAAKVQTVVVPDIGGAANVEVIEILVKPGDQVEKETSLITLEGDKATMEIPSPYTGKVVSIEAKVGDKLSKNSPILTLEMTEDQPSDKQDSAGKEKAPEKSKEKLKSEEPKKEEPKPEKEKIETAQKQKFEPKEEHVIHAGPAVRRIAHEIGLELSKIPATGEKGRITKEDVQNYVQTQLKIAEGGGASGVSIAAAPAIDFSLFGAVETQPLSRIQKISGSNLHRNWVNIPHVTQFDEVDITELENFRKEQKSSLEKKNIKLTPLVFIMKAVVAALKAFPRFNASLAGENLILKKYFHIGVAVDTPNGLVVPVIRDVDQKGLLDLARELAEISEKARTKGLSMTDMQGGCFSISSLGGIGGTAFTPIINAPEVAILGVSKSQIKPVWDQAQNDFISRLMLPLSLSYDHRVIDGAEAARFIVYLGNHLNDIRILLL